MNAELVNYDANPIQYTPVQHREKPLWHHLQGLQYTATGYGKKIPTSYQVLDGKRWKRVYCTIYSNSGTLWIVRSKNRVVVELF